MKPIIFCLLFMCLIFKTGHSQSKIEKAEDRLIEDKGQDSTTSDKEKNSLYSNINSESNFLTETIGHLLVEAFLYSSYYILIESPFEIEHKASLASITKYPYYNSEKGNYAYAWSEDTAIFRTAVSSRYLSENSTLKGLHLNVDLLFLKRLGFEANVLQLWENNTNFGSDNLAIYTMLAKYHRIRTERLDAWWGMGTSYVDGKVNQFGFTYGLGAELFFVKPMSLELNFNQTLVNSETVNKFNGLLSYHLNRYKFIGGYEHLKIGTENFSNITLGIGVFF